ncbi:MAG: hypothetical protein WDO13_04340 [Verrucomicrobiota bacterium]
MPLFVTTRVLPRLLPLLLLALPLRGQSLLPTPLPNTPQGAKPIAPAPAPAAPASEPAVPLPPPNPPPPVTQEKGRPIWGVYVGNDINGTLLHAYEMARPAHGRHPRLHRRGPTGRTTTAACPGRWISGRRPAAACCGPSRLSPTAPRWRKPRAGLTTTTGGRSRCGSPRGIPTNR